MDNMVHYKNMYVIIKIIKEENINDTNIILSVLDVIIKINDTKIDLGSFYIVLNNELNNKNLKIISRELIDNIDRIIFERSRFIGVLNKNKISSDDEILDYISIKHTRKYDVELKNMYLEFFDLDESTKEYKEYSYFLEMEFISHGIPDAIKNIYLKKKRKSILDYTNDKLNEEIRSSFINDYSEYINPYLYEEHVNKLKKVIKESVDELENMEEILNSLKNVTKDIQDNSKIIMQMDIIKSQIFKLNPLNPKRFNLKRKLNELKSSLHNVNEIEEIDKVKSNLKNNNYIKSLSSLIVIKEKIIKEYKTKYKEYNKLVKEYDEFYKKIEDYENNKIDISNLRERLDSI